MYYVPYRGVGIIFGSPHKRQQIIFYGTTTRFHIATATVVVVLSTKDFYTNTTTILTIGHTSLHCTYIPAAYNLRMYISRFRDRDYYAAGDEVYDKITMTWLRLRPGLT